MFLVNTGKKIERLGIGLLISTILLILLFYVLKVNAAGESIEFTAFIYWIFIHYFVLSLGIILLVLRIFRIIVKTSGWYYLVIGIFNFLFGASYPVILWIYRIHSAGKDSVTFIISLLAGFIILLDMFVDKRSA